MLSLSGRLSVETGFYGNALEVTNLTKALIERTTQDAYITKNFRATSEAENRKLVKEYHDDIKRIAKAAKNMEIQNWWDIAMNINKCLLIKASSENILNFIESLKTFKIE